jgi:hypothetical protein
MGSSRFFRRAFQARTSRRWQVASQHRPVFGGGLVAYPIFFQQTKFYPGQFPEKTG